MTQKNAADAKKRRNNCLFGFFTIIIVTIAIGCSTKKVVSESDVQRVVVQHTDTLRDSVWVERTHIERDSVIVFQRGDTVYRDRWRTDTIYQSKRDSIPYPVEVTKEVPAELTWWQQTRLYLANTLLVVLGLIGIGWGVKKRLSW